MTETTHSLACLTGEKITVISEEHGNGKLKYTLFKQLKTCGELSCDVYGIEIHCALFGDEESIEICDIVSNYLEARELFEMLSANLVTPSSLPSIVEDFIEEKYGV